MLSGRPLAARFIKRFEIEIVRQDERLKRFAGLRPVEYAGHVRSNQRFIASARPTSRTRTWESRHRTSPSDWRTCHLKHVEVGAERKSVRRLEPERRTQNDDLRLFSARQRGTDRFNAGHLGRSCQLPEKEN